MAQIASAPIVLRDVLLKLGTTDTYEAHVSSVRMVPNSTTITWQGLTPTAKFSRETEPTWTCEISGVQDWQTANSLALYLTANAGKELAVVFAPEKGAGKVQFTGTVVGKAVPIGGDVNTVPTFEVTLGMTGSPVSSNQP